MCTSAYGDRDIHMFAPDSVVYSLASVHSFQIKYVVMYIVHFVHFTGLDFILGIIDCLYNFVFMYINT